MLGRLRAGTGSLLLAAALGLIGFGVSCLRDQDFVGAAVFVAVGYGVLRTGAELLRPAMGE